MFGDDDNVCTTLEQSSQLALCVATAANDYDATFLQVEEGGKILFPGRI